MIPNLPTDNLYKFMATFGLALFLAGWIVPTRLLDDFALVQTREATRSAFLYLEVQALDDRMHKALERYGSHAEIPADLARHFTSEIERFDSIRTEMQITANEIDERRGRIRVWAWAGRLAMLAGAILMITGFYLWYHRVQKPLDQSLRDRIAAATNSSERGV